MRVPHGHVLHPHPAFGAMHAHRDVIEAYHRDLDWWDGSILRGMPVATPFAWYVYHCGTHLLRLEGKAVELVEQVNSIEHSFGHWRGQWFLWDGRSLAATTYADLVTDQIRRSL